MAGEKETQKRLHLAKKRPHLAKRDYVILCFVRIGRAYRSMGGALEVKTITRSQAGKTGSTEGVGGSWVSQAGGWSLEGADFFL